MQEDYMPNVMDRMFHDADDEEFQSQITQDGYRDI